MMLQLCLRLLVTLVQVLKVNTIEQILRRISSYHIELLIGFQSLGDANHLDLLMQLLPVHLAVMSLQLQCVDCILSILLYLNCYAIENILLDIALLSQPEFPDQASRRGSINKQSHHGHAAHVDENDVLDMCVY